MKCIDRYIINYIIYIWNFPFIEKLLIYLCHSLQNNFWKNIPLIALILYINIPLSEISLFSEITEKSYTFVENIHLREYDNSQRAIM